MTQVTENEVKLKFIKVKVRGEKKTWYESTLFSRHLQLIVLPETVKHTFLLISFYKNSRYRANKKWQFTSSLFAVKTLQGEEDTCTCRGNRKINSLLSEVMLNKFLLRKSNDVFQKWVWLRVFFGFYCPTANNVIMLLLYPECQHARHFSSAAHHSADIYRHFICCSDWSVSIKVNFFDK